MAQVNVNLAFNADTGKAKTQIMELQSLLSKIAYTGATGGTDKLQTDLHAASEAAKELQFHLNNAFNVSTGNFDLSMLDRSLKTSGTNIQKLSIELLSAGATGQQAFVKLAQSISLADQPMFRISNRMKEFAVTMKNTVKWQLSSSMLHGFMGAVQSAYGYAQDLNESLNNIRIVTGYNIDKMAQFAEQANKAAKALSTTTTDYTDASLIYFQQGLSDAEVQGRTDTTIKLANVTGQSVEETANQMTAIWNNFDDGSKSLDYYADVITALGAATASSSKEISEGLNKFSAIAESVGLSYEYASAALATVTATTRQSADVVGNSFKTLFARIQGLNLGETLDDGTTLNKYSEALSKVGINVKDQSGQLKDMNTILDEMGSKWNTLGKDQQVALAQTVGGVRQYTQLIALMDNWDYFQQNLGVATGAEGTLNKQAEIYAQSWEAAEKRVQAAAEGIYQSLLDDKFFISLNNGFANALNGIDAFIDGAGGVKTVLTGIAGIIISTFANKIPQALDTFKYNLTFLIKGTKDAYQDIQDKMTKATKMAFTGFENKTTGEKVQPIKEDSALGYQITAANELTAARSKLALVSDRMSASEKQMANTQLSIIEVAQEELVVLKQKNEALAESIKLQQESIQKSSIDNTTKTQSEKAEIDILALDKNVQRRYQEATNVFNEALNATEIPDDLGVFSDQQQQLEFLSTEMMGFSASYEEAVAEINSAYGSLGQNIFDKFIAPGDLSVKEEILEMPEWFTAAFNEIKSTVDFEGFLNDEFNFTTVQQQMVALSNTIPKAVQEATGLDRIFKNLGKARTEAEFVQEFKNLETKLQNCKIEGKDFQKVLESLYGKGKIGQLTNDMDKLAQNEVKATEKAGILKNLLNEFNPQHIVRTSEALGALAGMAGSAVTAVNGVISIFKAWGNPDLSGWEKVSATLSGIAMIVPTVMSSLQGLSTIISYITTKYGAQIAVMNLSSGAHARLASQIGTETIAEIANIAVKNKSAGASKTQAAAEIATYLNKQKGIGIIQANTAAQFMSNKVYEQGGKSILTYLAAQTAKIINDKLENSGRITGIILQTILNALIGKYAAIWMVLAGIGIVALITAIVAGLDALIVTQKEANEAIAEANSKYDEEKQKLDELKGSLKSVQDQIKELQSQDSLSLVEQEELDKLLEQEASLQRQVALQEQLAQAAKQESADTFEGKISKASKWINNTPDNRKTVTLFDKNLYGKVFTPEQFLAEINKLYTDEEGNILEGFKDKYTKAYKYYENWVNDYNSKQAEWVNANKDSFNEITEGYQNWFDIYGDKEGYEQQVLEYANLISNMNKAIYGEQYDDKVLGSMDKTFEASTDQKDKNVVNNIVKDLEDGIVDADPASIAEGFSDTFKQSLLRQGIIPDNYAQHLIDEYTRAASALKGEVSLEDLISSEDFNLEDLDILAHLQLTGEEDLDELLAKIKAYKDNTIEVEVNGFDLSKWTEQFNTIKDLKIGDTIDPEKWNQLDANMQQFFTKTIEGEYRLTVAADDLLNKLNDEIETEIESQQKQIEMGERAGGKYYNDIGKSALSNNVTEGSYNKDMVQAQLDFLKSQGIDTSQYTEKLLDENGNFKTVKSEDIEVFNELAEAAANVKLELDTLNESLNSNQAISATASTSIDELRNKLNDGTIDLQEYNDAFDNILTTEAKSENLDYESILNYAKYLSENAESLENVDDALQGNLDTAKKVALVQAKLNKAVQTLSDNWKDWNKAIKKGDMSELQNKLPAINDALKDMLDLTDEAFEGLSDDFAIKNWDTIKDVVNGVEGALEKLQVEAAKDYAINLGLSESQITEEMTSLMSELTLMAEGTELTVEPNIDNANAFDGLYELLTQAGFTADQIADIFDKLGWDPQIEYKEMTVSEAQKYTGGGYQTVLIPTDDGGWEEKSINLSAENDIAGLNKIKVPVIKGTKTSGGSGSYTPKSTSPGGGGGGGGGQKKHAEKKSSLEKTRYHTIQNQLEDLKDEYDEISEAADRAFGKEKLEAIDDEINKTDELINKQEEYLDAISQNLPIDKAVMEAYYNNVIGGPAIKFDEKGNISNYDAIQDAMFDKYNQMTSLDEDSEEWQAFEKKYEQLEKYIEQYEETYDLLRDEEAEYQDLLRQRIDLQLEKVQYSVEIQLDIPENEIAIIEYQLGKIEDDAFKSAEAIGLLTKKAENVYDQIQINKQGLNDLLELSLSTQEIVQLMNGDMSVLEGKTFTEDQIDSIKEYRDNLLDLNKELDDIRENIEEQVMEVFDAWNEKLEQGIDKLDHYGNVLESYKNIIDIVGKDTLGLSDAFMATLNQSSIDNAINKVTATKKSYESMIKAQSQAEQALEDAKARNDEASIKMWEENLQSITEEAQSAREEMLSVWKDALNGIAEQFETTVERLIENFNDSIYKLGGLEGLSEDFSRKKETQDLYVSDYQKIYELSKLTRDINNKIDDTDNIAGKQKLKKLLEQINELQKDGVEMSQYDLEYLQAEYDLRLAELELEEARNAKNTVRLQRDNEGNWSYVYTQNTDAVDQAQQKYEDALYAMQDLSTQYIDEMSEKLISTSQEMQEAIAAVRIQDFESQDAYYKEIDRIYRLYQDQLGQQESELNKAVANNKVLYDTDWTNYHNATGYKISDTENFVTTFKDSLLGTLLGSDQLTSNFSSMIGETAGQLIENLMSAANDYYTNLNTAMEAAGTSTGTFSDVLAEDVLSIQTNSEIASNAVKSMAEQMDTSIGNIMSSVEKWQIDYGNQIDLILNKNLQLINSFNDMIKVLSGGDMSGIDISYNILRTQDQDTENIASGDTGMYTGNWGTKDGKLAILHEKELVLNANDTENMLNMLELTRYLTSVIDVNAKQLSQGIGLLQPATIKEDSREILEQQVHIQAEFPNVNDHNEIEEAFNSLINTASQYAYRK